MRNSKKVASVIALALVAISATAGATELGNFGVGVNVGTQGLGIEATKSILPETLNARVGVYGGSYNTSKTTDSINYDYGIKLFNAGVFADYYPFHNSFRLSAGIIDNGNKANVNANSNGSGNITVNGNNYSTSDLTSIHGDVKYKTIAPYLGIGGGNTASVKQGFTFTWDVGVIFTGSPTVNLSANCGASTSAATCSAIQSDVAAERTKLNNDVSSYKYWPVIKIGVGYAF